MTTSSTSPTIDMAFATRSGTVASFDDHEGTGTIGDHGSSVVVPFHCTRITGASRTIAPGTAVTYVVAPGPGGLEAMAVTPRA